MKKYISVLIISIISILSFSNIAFAMESNVYPEGDSRAEQSNGAGMAQNLAVRCSDIFAAAALGAHAYFDEEYFGPVDNIHEMAIIFSYGSEDEYLKKFHMTADINDIPAIRHLEYWRGLYGFDQDFYRKEQKNIFTMYTFTNRYNIPVVQWFVVEGKDHSYPKEEVGLFYDFMKCYT